MTTAIEIKALQAAMKSQDALLLDAILRCDQILAEFAQTKRETSTTVTVFGLDVSTLKLLEKDLKARGFKVISEYRSPDRSVVTIGW